MSEAISETIVVNCSYEAFDVYIGQQYNPQLFDYGNPYPWTIYGRLECLARYREYFWKRINDPNDIFKEKIEELRGKRLGCHCKPDLKCHGDIIVEYLNIEKVW